MDCPDSGDRMPTVVSGVSLAADQVDLETPFAPGAGQQRRGDSDGSSGSPARRTRSRSGEHPRGSRISAEVERAGVALRRTNSGVARFLRPLAKPKIDHKARSLVPLHSLSLPRLPQLYLLGYSLCPLPLQLSCECIPSPCLDAYTLPFPHT